MSEVTSEEKESLPVHVEMCSQRYRELRGQLLHVRYVLYAIVLLLLLGEGTIAEVAKRLLVPHP